MCVCSNLVINYPTSWKLLLKALIECMIMHGHYARELLLSTLCSLPKTKMFATWEIFEALHSHRVWLKYWIGLYWWDVTAISKPVIYSSPTKSTIYVYLSVGWRKLLSIIAHVEAKCIVVYWTPLKLLIVSDLRNCLKFSLTKMSQFAICEFSLICAPGKEFVPCGKAAFQKNFKQITECVKGVFCPLYSSPCILILF